MPLTTADLPADEPAEKPATKKKSEPVSLAKAGESGDAAVQNLLARRGCTEDEAQLAEIDAELAELGYAV